MTNSKSTKRALLSSAFAILVCVAMLIGTTFAWFTDTASTAVNKIQAGNLKVLLVDEDGKDLEGKPLEWKTADGRAQADILWEPGCTYELQPVRVKNDGNLALKYKIVITGINGSAKLNEVIDWTINDTNLESDHKLAAGAVSEPLTIKGHMQDTAGNEYMNEKIENIAITVYATQDTVENDSYGNQYDEKAAYKGTQDFTSGTHTLNKGGVALNKNDIAVKVSGNNTDVTITGGYYDGGNGGNNQCVHVRDGAKVTIKNGTFTVGCDANGDGNSVIESNGGNIIIEGGFFYTNYSWRGFYYVLNQNNSNPGTITVKGGTFVNYDPSKGDDNLGGNFVADGYSVISETKANGEVWYTVVKGAGAVVGSQEDLNKVISGSNVATVKLTEGGEYTLPTLSGKDVTVIGNKDTVINMKDKLNNGAANIAFEGVTVNFGTQNYKGFQHTGKLVYKDCVITGKQFLYGNEVEFINCTFVQDEVDYNVWTYGAGKVLFKSCEFNCKGKSVLIYNEGALTAQTVEFQNCKFNASAPAEGKAAIEIDSRFTSYNVIIDKSTADNVKGFGVGSNSNNSVWNVKAQAKTTVVTVDGTTVYSE